MCSLAEPCANCPVQSSCLPFGLGFTRARDGAVPHRRIERSPGEMILNNGEDHDIVAVTSGWCARYVMFPDGRRQIVDIVLPGGFIGCSEIAAVPDSLPLVALSDVEACVFDRKSFVSAVTASSQVFMQVMEACGGQGVRMRNLLAAMGQQSGAPRVASFLVDLHRRLVAIGQASETEMPYHLRQKDLADTLGMTQVHVSRTLRSLEEDEVLSIRERVLHILKPDKLERLARA